MEQRGFNSRKTIAVEWSLQGRYRWGGMVSHKLGDGWWVVVAVAIAITVAGKDGTGRLAGAG